jgi:hypothetical protein
MNQAKKHLAYQEQSPEFKPQYNQKKKKGNKSVSS